MFAKIRPPAAFNRAVDEAGVTQALFAQVRQNLEERLDHLASREAAAADRRDFLRWFEADRTRIGAWDSQSRIHLWQGCRRSFIWLAGVGQWSHPLELRQGSGRTQELLEELLASQGRLVFFRHGTRRARSARRLLRFAPTAFRRDLYHTGPPAGGRHYSFSLLLPVVVHRDHRQLR